MDFVQFINDQSTKVKESNSYFKYLWDSITTDGHSDEMDQVNATDKKRFADHIPLNLQSFLTDCIHKVQDVLEDGSSLAWSKLNTKYLSVFIYWTLQQFQEINVLVSLSAARLYFLLNSLPGHEDQTVHYESIYTAALTVIEYCSNDENMSVHVHCVLENFKGFAAVNRLPKPLIKQTCSILYKIISEDSPITFNSFPIGNYSYVVLVEVESNHFVLNLNICKLGEIRTAFCFK